MKIFKNEYGVALGGDESKKKPGTFFFEGAEDLVPVYLAQGLTNVSVRVSQYGPMIQFSKPFVKKEAQAQEEP